MTLEEAQARIAALETAAAKHSTDLESARNEAAKHRVARNEALRREHALGKVISAHNISFDVSKADVGGLTINDGKVEGEFDYTPPSTTQRQAPRQEPTKTGGLTLEEVKKMSPDKINERWEEVSKLLETE